MPVHGTTDEFSSDVFPWAVYSNSEHNFKHHCEGMALRIIQIHARKTATKMCSTTKAVAINNDNNSAKIQYIKKYTRHIHNYKHPHTHTDRIIPMKKSPKLLPVIAHIRKFSLT